LNWSILQQSKNQPKLSSTTPKNLKFGNYTGSGVTSNHIINFKKAVVDATSVWGGNIAKNLDYITNYMNSYGGNPGD
jgi:hypothetical protein